MRALGVRHIYGDVECYKPYLKQEHRVHVYNPVLLGRRRPRCKVA